MTAPAEHDPILIADPEPDPDTGPPPDPSKPKPESRNPRNGRTVPPITVPPARTGPPPNGPPAPASAGGQPPPPKAPEPNSLGAPPPPAAAAPAAPAPPPATPAAPPPATPAAPPPPAKPPPPVIDPELVKSLAPAAMMALPMAMMALPMLGSALSGLLGGAGGGSGAATPAASPATASPDTDRARKLLQLLAALYGNGDPQNADAAGLDWQLGNTPGSGNTAAAHQALAVYQRNVAGAFNHLDTDLAKDIQKLAGTNKVDQKIITQVVHDVDTQLASLGPYAYTAAGQQQVRAILANALTKAEKIVHKGKSNTGEISKDVDNLTANYINDLAGAGSQSAGGAAGGSSSVSSRVLTAIRAAESKRGLPYIYGGNGPNGYDCSSLMQYAARQAGVGLPRTASQQYQATKRNEVNPRNIKPGDLIFPSAQFNGGNPGHVIMYVGNGKCIAASHTGVPIGYVPLPSSFHATRWTA